MHIKACLQKIRMQSVYVPHHPNAQVQPMPSERVRLQLPPGSPPSNDWRPRTAAGRAEDRHGAA